MTTNLERAARELATWPAPHLSEQEQDEQGNDMAQELATQGLIAPDLPSPDARTASGGHRWLTDELPVINAAGGRVGVLYPTVGMEHGITPGKAREWAYILLAAANHAEDTDHDQ
ncbi:MAG TPA: hypothetical protein DCL06_06255 [Corynebacterium variabile]|uniref:Uncharacterized protein n=1 Tax=Corynebacterium variabile TaxID=1727 RepID=A0A3B9QU94_9CORY|nr:hypothetical protein [Corynebacterium variabile]